MRKDITIEKLLIGEKVNKSALARQYGCCWRTIDKRLNPNKYQKENKKYFSYKEILSIKDTLLFIYTDRLKNLCEEEQKNLLIFTFLNCQII